MGVGVDADAVRRFARDLAPLLPGGGPVGLAVSGGPDSMAMLALAHAALPGRILAATVDHALRPGSDAEARTVSACCAEIDVPHRVLKADWQGSPPSANVEARARAARYLLLSDWANARGIEAVATAHHADDQAETLLMRLARGAGLSGLAGVRPSTRIAGVRIVRPLLRWRREELTAIAKAARLPTADDPHNRDTAFDRSRLRMALAKAGFGDAEGFAASARHLAQADIALEWVVRDHWDARAVEEEDGLRLAIADMPAELQRRMLIAAIERSGDRPPRGPDLERVRQRLLDGEAATLGSLSFTVEGEHWRLSPAPPRRTG